MKHPFPADISIVTDVPGEPLVILDRNLGNRSVTNDAEAVVAELIAGGFLPGDRRLLYYDSEGMLDELLIKDGRFVGSAPGPGRKAAIGEGLGDEGQIP